MNLQLAPNRRSADPGPWPVMGPFADDGARFVRRWIYVYFVLLIAEGALRKWVFSSSPAIAEALLVIRDPVAVIIYFSAWRANRLPSQLSLLLCALSTLVLSTLGILQLIAIKDLLPAVVLFGIRTYCLHVPLIFIMAEVLRTEDILRIGRLVLYVSVPMAVLMVAQFIVPSDHFLNRGAMGAGEGGIGQIESAFGRIRPAGLFSYNNGATSFNLLAAAFWLYSFVDEGWLSRPARWLSGLSLVCILPVSGSRTFVLSFALLLIFSFIGGNFNARLMGVTLKAYCIIATTFFALTFTGFFRDGLAAFSSRWDAALDDNGSVQNSIVMRFFGEYENAFGLAKETPLIGKGLGLGSNVGSKLTIGDLDFLLAETETERDVLEMGPVVGAVWLLARWAFAFFILGKSWICVRRGVVLPWLLLGMECTSIFNGSLAQPTSLGFIVFTTGLCLAATKVHDQRAPSGPILRRMTAAAAEGARFSGVS